MSTRKPYLAAYDITSPGRLRAALLVLKGYAGGRQKSVFECHLTPAECQLLLHEIAEVMQPVEDRFVLLPLRAGRPVKTLGIGVPMQDPDWYYIG